jgi:preprotein translocase subunit SecB
MSDTQAEQSGTQTTTPLTILVQYTKDLSMENPGAPDSLLPGQPTPNVNVNVDVNARKMDEERGLYEVILRVKAEARTEQRAYFLIELSYAGVVLVSDQVPAEHRPTVVMLEGPRQLFPFARAIVADATRDAGYPPLMIQPIDFLDLLRRKSEAMSKSGDLETVGNA